MLPVQPAIAVSICYMYSTALAKLVLICTSQTAMASAAAAAHRQLFTPLKKSIITHP